MPLIMSESAILAQVFENLVSLLNESFCKEIWKTSHFFMEETKGQGLKKMGKLCYLLLLMTLVFLFG